MMAEGPYALHLRDLEQKTEICLADITAGEVRLAAGPPNDEEKCYLPET